MSNQTVDDCEGFFFDSDNGIVPLDYGHNEDLTFSICPLGADSITMVFNDFCTEINNDVLRFFDGPDTFSAPIGIKFFRADSNPAYPSNKWLFDHTLSAPMLL